MISPANHCIWPDTASFLGHPFLSLTILGPHKHHYALTLVHQWWSFTICRVSTLAHKLGISIVLKVMLRWTMVKNPQLLVTN
jgi:hypothetical protein